MTAHGFGTLDAAVLALYLVALAGLALWAGRRAGKSHDAAEFFLTRASLPWYVIGFSIIAAGVSSEQFLGTVGFAYRHGLVVANWEWLNGPAMLLLIVVFVPLYLRRQVRTMPQYLDQRFGPRVRNLFTWITIVTYVFINLAGVIYSGAFALNRMLGLELWLGVLLVAGAAGAITLTGGLESVAWTNVFQSALLIGSGIVIVVVGAWELPGGFSALIGEGDRAHLVLPTDHPALPWPALVVLMLSTNVWYYCTNQTINQSALGARTPWDARMGVVFAGFLYLLVPLADVFPGLIAHALEPNLPRADDAFPFVVATLLPAGLRGLVFAGLVGAIVSTIEALTNAVSAIFALDVYRPARPAAPDRAVKRAGQAMGAAALVVGAAWVPMVMRFEDIFSYFQECWAFVAIPTAVVFLGGALWRGASARAALATMALSFPLFGVPYLLREGGIGANPFVVAGGVLAFIAAVFVALSRALPDRAPASAGGATDDARPIWTPAMARDPAARRPGLRSVGLWASLMLAAYATLYALFW